MAGPRVGYDFYHGDMENRFDPLAMVAKIPLHGEAYKEYVESYDDFTKSLAKYPKEQTNPAIVEAMYCALGLVGEAGEVSEKIKKWHRDGKIDPKAVALECGDVLYYLTRVANCMGFTLEDVERLNREKLSARKLNNTIHGEGDNR